MFVEQPLPVVKIDNLGIRHRRLQRALDKGVQDLYNRVDGGEDVGLGSPQGGKSPSGQPELQGAEIAATEGEVMQEVPSAFPVIGMNIVETLPGIVRGGDELCPNGCKLPEKVLSVGAFQTSGIGGVFCF
jgi:hypothetical protein